MQNEIILLATRLTRKGIMDANILAKCSACITRILIFAIELQMTTIFRMVKDKYAKQMPIDDPIGW